MMITGNSWCIALHGGAGVISKDNPNKDAYLKCLKHALDRAIDYLQAGSDAVDVVQNVCELLENYPLFNTGLGSVLNELGKCELEASIMKSDKSCGAAAGLLHVKNPIRLARAIMDKTSHHMLIGEGAEKFAHKVGLEMVENSDYFITPERKRQWEEYVQEKIKLDKLGMGTIGCVARDMNGNMAAGTSTGGRTFKMHGRVGDTPIIGAGNYCNSFAAVSGTGIGEYFIRDNVAAQVCARMEFGKSPLHNSVKSAIDAFPPDVGGVIAVDKDNNISMQFNSAGMHRAAASSSGYYFVGIWEEVEISQR